MDRRTDRVCPSRNDGFGRGTHEHQSDSKREQRKCLHLLPHWRRDRPDGTGIGGGFTLQEHHGRRRDADGRLRTGRFRGDDAAKRPYRGVLGEERHHPA